MFLLNMNEINCCSEPNIKKVGISLPCFNCKNMNEGNISVNCCNDQELFDCVSDIVCMSCKTIMPNTMDNDKITFKKKCRLIDRRFKYMLHKFHNYVIYDELYNMSSHRKNLICKFLKIILNNHIDLYGEKTKMIDIDFLLLEVFELLGFDLGVYLNSRKRKFYKNYFEKMINYSYVDLADIINQFV